MSARAYREATLESAVAHVLIQQQPDGVVIVAFRGTENLRDWVTDLEVRRGRPIHEMVGSPSLSNGEKVHRGFLYSVSSVLPEAVAELQKVRDCPVVVTGHSKGGAEAMIAAAALLGAEFDVQGVYTFGQPRVGNAAFVNSYETKRNLGQRTFRFVYEEDLVPRVPGVLIGYRHAGREIFFPSDRKGFEVNPSVTLKVLSDCAGVARDFVTRRISVIQDHFVTEYQYRFTKEFGTAETNVREVAA